MGCCTLSERWCGCEGAGVGAQSPESVTEEASVPFNDFFSLTQWETRYTQYSNINVNLCKIYVNLHTLSKAFIINVLMMLFICLCVARKCFTLDLRICILVKMWNVYMNYDDAIKKPQWANMQDTPQLIPVRCIFIMHNIYAYLQLEVAK